MGFFIDLTFPVDASSNTMTTRSICWEVKVALSALVGFLLKVVTSLHGYEQDKFQPTSSQSSSLRRIDGYTDWWMGGYLG